jgi:hypothetical protein
MSMTQEKQQEFRDSALLLSAPELQGMLGGDAEEDAIINSILSAGKQVEVPGLPDVRDDAGDADDADEDDDADDDQGDDADGADDGADDAAAAEHAAAPAPEAPAPAADPDFTPPALDLTPLAAEFNTRMEALRAEKKALTAKLMAGELEADEYSDLEEKNLAARDALREEQDINKRWFTDVHNFRVQAAKTSGINYFTDTEKDSALDGWVKVLAAKPENYEKPATWFLEQAHKKVMIEFDIAAPAPKAPENGTKNVADGKKVAPKTARTPNLSGIPPTLGGLPAAAPATGGDGGEFAHLDKLSGFEYEKAIARMTPEQRDRWSSM